MSVEENNDTIIQNYRKYVLSSYIITINGYDIEINVDTANKSELLYQLINCELISFCSQYFLFSMVVKPSPRKWLALCVSS